MAENSWDLAAITRKEQIESGIDITFTDVFGPIWKEIVLLYKATRLIEIGSGTGHLALQVSKLVDDLTAIEPSRGMYTVSTEVLHGSPVKLFNAGVEAFESPKGYDLAISHLVLHSVDGLLNFLTSANRLLSPGGRLVYSLPHPCFYQEYKRMLPEDYSYMREQHAQIEFKITKSDQKIEGVPYVHRPISSYIKATIESGFIIEDFVEVFPSESVQMKYGALWKNPRYCYFVCQKSEG